MKTYDECYDVIAKHSAFALQFFADHWSRFPCGHNADIVIDDLKKQLAFYERKINPTLPPEIAISAEKKAADIRETITSINEQREY